MQIPHALERVVAWPLLAQSCDLFLHPVLEALGLDARARGRPDGEDRSPAAERERINLYVLRHLPRAHEAPVQKAATPGAQDVRRNLQRIEFRGAVARDAVGEVDAEKGYPVRHH